MSKLNSLAKRWPALNIVVLRPNSPSPGSASCLSCLSYASCAHAPHLVTSDASGDPCLYWVLSGHMQLSNRASLAS